MDVVKCFNRPMDRQISEGCHILSPDADIMMNGKLDHMRPVVGRVVISTAVQSNQHKTTLNTKCMLETEETYW